MLRFLIQILNVLIFLRLSNGCDVQIPVISQYQYDALFLNVSTTMWTTVSFGGTVCWDLSNLPNVKTYKRLKLVLSPLDYHYNFAQQVFFYSDLSMKCLQTRTCGPDDSGNNLNPFIAKTKADNKLYVPATTNYDGGCCSSYGCCICKHYYVAYCGCAIDGQKRVASQVGSSGIAHYYGTFYLDDVAVASMEYNGGNILVNLATPYFSMLVQGNSGFQQIDSTFKGAYVTGYTGSNYRVAPTTWFKSGFCATPLSKGWLHAPSEERIADCLTSIRNQLGLRCNADSEDLILDNKRIEESKFSEFLTANEFSSAFDSFQGSLGSASPFLVRTTKQSLILQLALSITGVSPVADGGDVSKISCVATTSTDAQGTLINCTTTCTSEGTVFIQSDITNLGQMVQCACGHCTIKINSQKNFTVCVYNPKKLSSGPCISGSIDRKDVGNYSYINALTGSVESKPKFSGSEMISGFFNPGSAFSFAQCLGEVGCILQHVVSSIGCVATYGAFVLGVFFLCREAYRHREIIISALGYLSNQEWVKEKIKMVKESASHEYLNLKAFIKDCTDGLSAKEIAMLSMGKNPFKEQKMSFAEYSKLCKVYLGLHDKLTLGALGLKLFSEKSFDDMDSLQTKLFAMGFPAFLYPKYHYHFFKSDDKKELMEGVDQNQVKFHIYRLEPSLFSIELTTGSFPSELSCSHTEGCTYCDFKKAMATSGDEHSYTSPATLDTEDGRRIFKKAQNSNRNFMII